MNKCINCQERYLGCHANCTSYQEFKNECEEKNKKYRQYMDGRGYDFCLAPKSGKIKHYQLTRF